jgi:hypothetical protein
MDKYKYLSSNAMSNTTHLQINLLCVLPDLAGNYF